MKYYIEIKTKFLQDIIKKIHSSKATLAFYFDNKNTIRVFCDNEFTLSTLFGINALATPKTKRFVLCQRVHSANRSTKNQVEKRRKKLVIKLAMKDIQYDKNHGAIKNTAVDYDYFINCYSSSSNKHFKLFVKNTVVVKNKIGAFSSYGLSLKDATLPFF